MGKYVLALFFTVLVGYLADAVVGSLLNWPCAGAIFAIAVMGLFLLNELENLKEKK